MLNEGYRSQHRHYIMLAHIADLPSMKDEARLEFYRQLEWASKPPSDILSSNGKGSTEAQIKKALGG